MGAQVMQRMQDRVAVLTLDDPAKRNALSSAAVKALVIQLRAAEVDEQVRAVVITGAGTTFSSGADLSDRTVHTAKTVDDVPSGGAGIFDVVAGCAKPTIAAINGPAIGAGANLALSCDLRVCADSAWVQWPQVRFGVMPGTGVLARLAHIVGSARALDWVLTTRKIAAEDGLAAGLYARTAPHATSLDAALELGRTIAEHPSTSMRFAREAVASMMHRDVAQTADTDIYRGYILFNSKERIEASERWREQRASRLRAASAGGDL